MTTIAEVDGNVRTQHVQFTNSKGEVLKIHMDGTVILTQMNEDGVLQEPQHFTEQEFIEAGHSFNAINIMSQFDGKITFIDPVYNQEFIEDLKNIGIAKPNALSEHTLAALFEAWQNKESIKVSTNPSILNILREGTARLGYDYYAKYKDAFPTVEENLDQLLEFYLTTVSQDELLMFIFALDQAMNLIDTNKEMAEKICSFGKKGDAGADFDFKITGFEIDFKNPDNKMPLLINEGKIEDYLSSIHGKVRHSHENDNDVKLVIDGINRDRNMMNDIEIIVRGMYNAYRNDGKISKTIIRDFFNNKLKVHNWIESDLEIVLVFYNEKRNEITMIQIVCNNKISDNIFIGTNLENIHFYTYDSMGKWTVNNEIWKNEV